jgi:putative flippase GtrA
MPKKLLILNFFDKLKRLFCEISSGSKISHQVIRHLCVGGLGVIFNVTCFTFLRHFFNLPTIISGLLTHIFLYIFIFPFQKFFTFKNYQRKLIQYIRFFLISITYVLLDISLAYLFIDIMEYSVLAGKILALSLLTPFSFMSQRFFVFNSR